MMYRALILRRLALAERYSAEAESLILAQQILLERARQQGLTGSAHAATLRRLTEAQAVRLATRDRLRAELHALDDDPRGARGEPSTEDRPARDARELH